VLQTGVMAEDPNTDIERLLREIDATTGGSSKQPQAQSRAKASPPATTSAGGAGGRLAFAVGSGVVLGAAGWFGGLLMPFIGSFSTGVGAAFGAFVAALIAGPPRWFSS
jgi:ferric-dicitrate binding protein FerR (iron transport regulator)